MTYYSDTVLSIPNATPETTDAAQYMYRHGKKQFNLCGEFSVAFCAKDHFQNDNIEDFLDYWQAKQLKWYQSVFYNGLSRTTGIYDLEVMLKEYGYDVPAQRFATVPMTPDAVANKLVGFQAIVGVKIDWTGYLVGSGIAHWVALDRINVIDKNHAIVDIYNPYTNRKEPYSWREFMTSTGSYKNGIWVKRYETNSGILQEQKLE